MTDWRPLERELGLWQENGRVAALWLRDDDAEVPKSVPSTACSRSPRRMGFSCCSPSFRFEWSRRLPSGFTACGMSSRRFTGSAISITPAKERRVRAREARSADVVLAEPVRRASAWRGSSRPCRAFWYRQWNRIARGSRNGSARPASRRYRLRMDAGRIRECGSSILMSI